jgi:SpoVK/Ycf46/Vps4 family AAA+-type ATPase
MMCFLISHRVIAMTKTRLVKTDKKITPEIVSRKLCLKALLIITHNQPAKDDYDEREYRDLLGITRNKLNRMRKHELMNRIRNKLQQLPEITCEDILSFYPLLRSLGAALQLTKVEQVLLLLMIWFHHENHWINISSLLGEMTHRKVCVFLARLIEVREGDVIAALSYGGTLIRSGLLKRESRGCWDIANLYDVLEGLDEHALQDQGRWDELIKSLFTSPVHNKLALDDFDYLGMIVSPALQLLEGALRRNRQGTHILLYGAPGTGKTELAQALGKHLNAKLLSVNTKNLEGAETEGMSRFRSYLLGQRLFKGAGNTLFIFDELEDVFPAHFGIFFRDSSAFHKGFMNEELENTSSPTIWTANNLDYVDEAHLRRFSCIIEVPVPPMSVRKRLLSNELKNKNISETWVNRIAESRSLTPAEIASLGTTVETTGVTGQEAEALMEIVLKEKMRAMGHKPIQTKRKHDQIPYNFDYLNLDAKPEVFLQGLRQSQSASLLLYGPPGTGKSALAKHLSDQLDKPIVIKRGSDLLSMWVGGTEKNIAQAFHAAERENAILFLDEADSFLRSRELAQRSWEVTEVNEMLVQMENFEGIFIAATNLIDNFDLAAFRRFDMKIRFDCLTPEQRWEVFVKLLREKPDNPEELRDQYISQLAQLDDLSIGDYRAAIRNLNIRNTTVTAETLFNVLMEECKFKHLDKMNKRPVGFVTH